MSNSVCPVFTKVGTGEMAMVLRALLNTELQGALRDQSRASPLSSDVKYSTVTHKGIIYAKRNM